MCGKNKKMSTNLKRVKTKSMKNIEMVFHVIRQFQDWENVFRNFTHLHPGSIEYNKAK